MMRNFWIKTNVDGNRTTLETGPRNRKGGFRQSVYINLNGESVLAAVMEGTADEQGNLLLKVLPGTDVDHSSYLSGFEVTATAKN